MNRSSPLYKMFSEVPDGYDRMNRLFTLRLDEYWRNKTANIILERKPYRVLDLCTGTGDLCIRLARRAAGQDMEIYAIDFSAAMLDVARKKIRRAGIRLVRLVEGDISAMPFPDGYFDVIGSAFAFRNLTFRNPKTDAYMKDISRVLKKGGVFVFAETSQPGNPLWASLFRMYLKHIMSPVASRLSGHPAAYRYLAHSAANYFHPQKVKELLQQYGFSDISHTPLMGGIAALHRATRY